MGSEPEEKKPTRPKYFQFGDELLFEEENNQNNQYEEFQQQPHQKLEEHPKLTRCFTNAKDFSNKKPLNYDYDYNYEENEKLNQSQAYYCPSYFDYYN